MKIHLPAVVLVSLLVVSGCGPQVVSSPPPAREERGPQETRSPHVVLVSIDGLRPDAIETFQLPTLQRLVRSGAYTLSAATVLPSRTLPSHVSMLTGVLPGEHRILWNRAAFVPRDRVRSPTIFEIARASGLRTAAFFSKAKFGVLQREGTLDYSQAPGGWFGRWPSDRTASDVATYLATARPHLLFVHLPDPDSTGHREGWMTQEYAQAALFADTALARIIAAASRAYGDGNFTLIVTADHGGHGKDHGSTDPFDVDIPWIAWGRGVRPGVLAGVQVRTVDSAATVLWLLGVETPPGWSGRPVAEGFVTD